MGLERSGQEYTLLTFDGQGWLIVRDGRVEISKELIVDGEPGVTPVWEGTLTELIAALGK